MIESRDCGTPSGLSCRQIHAVSRARADQPRSANMQFADRRRHLLDRADFFDDETVRQKSLIDQLHDGLILRLKPDRSKILAADFHRFGYDMKGESAWSSETGASRPGVGCSALL